MARGSSCANGLTTLAGAARTTVLMATKTVAYLRVSTDKQADRGVSLDAQRVKVAAYAELYDLDVIVDSGGSAKSLDRPGLQRALGMLKRGEAEALLVVKLDRLTRSVVDLGSLVVRYFAPGKAALMSRRADRHPECSGTAGAQRARFNQPEGTRGDR